MPKAAGVEAAQGEELEGEGHDRKEDREAEADGDELPGISGTRSERRRRWRPGPRPEWRRQRLQSGDLIADMLGKDDVRSPAGGRSECERNAEGV